MAKKSTYVSQAKTVSIRFTSRAAVKIGDNYFTIEACEERVIPDVSGVDIDRERELLWDTVNSECDNQIQDIMTAYKK